VSQDRPPAVVLLSGGLDSTTALAIAVSQGYRPQALTVNYGQRHDAELAAARKVAAFFGAERHVVVDLDLRSFGGSALTGDLDVPHHEHVGQLGPGIPVTYVPGRNTVFLSLAMAWAEVLGAWDVFIGVTAVDYSGYPDCRPEFIAAFESMANLATKAAVEKGPHFRVHAPLATLSKAEIIARGLELGVDYSLTHSCYDPGPDGRPCGTCDACLLRKRGFAQLGMTDPAPAAALGP
jgi:7-cyano-7-deazaguanine synthase